MTGTSELTSNSDIPAYQPLTLTTQELSAFLPGYSEHQLQEALEGLQQLHRYAFQQQGIHAGTFNDYIMPCFPVLQGIERLTAPNSQLNSLLILGDSGTGKSLLGKHVVWNAWKNFKPGDRIPLFISLASIKKQGPHKLKNNLLKTALKNFLESDNRFIKYLQAYNRWLLIFDGYDEIGYQGNLYIENELVNYNIKLITTCRPEALPSHDYQAWFHGYKALVQNEEEAFWEVRLTPFNETQIKTYLKCRSRHDFLDIEDNAERLEKIEQRAQERWELLETMPSVKALAENPFILSRIIPVLSQLQERQKQGQDTNEDAEENTYQLTRSEVYEVFVADWFQSQAQRIQQQGYFKTLSLKRLTALLHSYAENLAHTCLKNGQIEIEITEPTTCDRELLKARYPSQQGLEKNERDVLDENQLNALRSGCLLKTCAGGFNFIHKSLIEYFCAKDLFNGVMANIEGTYRSLLLRSPDETENETQKAKPAFHEAPIRDPQTLRLLVDEIIRKPQFKLVLWHLVELSKSEAYLATASANAMTLLNLAGESFVGKDLQGARFSGADLRESNFSGANLAEVDATGVSFSQACLFNTQLQSAILTDVEFGGTHILGKKGRMFGMPIDAAVIACCFSHQNNLLAIAQATGHALLYDTNNWSYTLINNKKTLIDILVLSSHLAFSPNDDYLLIINNKVILPTQHKLQVNLYHCQSKHFFSLDDYLLPIARGKKATTHNSVLKFCSAFSLDNNLMVIAYTRYDHQIFVNLYCLTAKKRIAQQSYDSMQWATKLIFSPDSSKLRVIYLDKDENPLVNTYSVPALEEKNSQSYQMDIEGIGFADISRYNAYPLLAIGEASGFSVYQESQLLWHQASDKIKLLRFICREKYLLVANEYNWQLWEVKSQKCLHTRELKFNAEDICLSHDERTVAWLDMQGKASVWLIMEGLYLKTYSISYRCVALSPQGEYIATITAGSTGFSPLHLLEIQKNPGTHSIHSNFFIKKPTQLHPMHNELDKLCMQNTRLISTDNKYLAKIKENEVHLYTLPNKEIYSSLDWLQVEDCSIESKLITLAFSEPSRYLAVGISVEKDYSALALNHCLIQIWSLTNNSLYHIFHRHGIGQKLDELQLSFISFKNKFLLLSAIPQKKIILYDVENKQKFLSIHTERTPIPFVLTTMAVAAAKNEQWIVWEVGSRQCLNFYSLETRKLAFKIHIGQANFDKLFFNHDSQFLYASNKNGSYLWHFQPYNLHCPLLLLATTAEPFLDLHYADFTNALGLADYHITFLKKQHALGKINTMPIETVARERMIRNSRQKIYTPTTTTIFNTGLMLDPAIGVAYLAIMKDDFHSFILLEYVENQQRYFKKLELVIDENKPLHHKLFNVTGNAQIRIKDVDEKTILDRANTQGYQGFCLGNVTRRQLEQLIKLAERDQNALIKYSRNAKNINYWSGLALNPLINQFPSLASLKPNDNSYNCFKWCKTILAEAKIYNKELERAEDPQVTFKEKVFAFATDNPRLYLTRRLQLTIDEMAEQEKQTTKTNMTL